LLVLSPVFILPKAGDNLFITKMKKSILTCFIICLALVANAQEISLYDSEGAPKAYIDFDQEATIFMWDGTPVAFLENDGQDKAVFGFNGHFLGWYTNGILYDKNGYMVGSRKDATIMVTQIEPIKSIQQITPIQPVTPITPIQPILKLNWSTTSLVEFLGQ
jgi:hypothetical protein